MRRVLIIEPSSTLRHALRKLLEDDNELIVEASFDKGLEHLKQTRLDAIVLGWPSQTNPVTDELLAYLSEPACADIPVLVLAHEPDPAKLNWTTGRPRTAFLLWENYDEAANCLGQLLSHSLTMLAIPDDGEIIHLLLVDDSPTARVKFSRLLKKTGLYQVTTAASVEEALQKIEQQPVEIAIIDYFMPNQTGDVLCHKLRENNATASVLSAILTSTYSDKVIADALAAGAVECMFKNEPDELFLARVAAMRRTVRIAKSNEQERRRLEGILSSVGDGVFGVNQEGIITFANPAVYKIVGNHKDSLIGQAADDCFHAKHETQDQVTYYLHNTLKEGRPQHNIESVFLREDNAPIQVEQTIYPLHINGKQEGAVVAFRDISMRKLLEEELKWQVNHDSLTKLLNRKYLEDSLEQEVKRLQRSEDISALLYIDLDRFKYINDTIGHTAGDQLLIEISEQLHSRLRRSDLLARIGGDEFAILLRDIDNHKLHEICETFHQILSNYTFHFQGRSYKVHVSIGVAMIDQQSQSAGEVLSNADIACTMAKSKGRNQTHVYSQEQDERAAMDMELGWSVRLQQALDKDQFVLHYQPIVPLNRIDCQHLPDDSGLLWDLLLEQNDELPKCFEVLIRLKNSNDELISPVAFLPTAERFNMMQRIDAWVIQRAMKELKQIQDQNIRLCINLSGQSLHSETLLDLFQHGLVENQVKSQQIMLEITESCAIYDGQGAKQFIDAMQALGCSFALDDFGSGYSSFAYLKNLPVDVIKIDGTFVKDILTDPMDLAIVTSINNIAHSLGKKTVAEFVENADILRQLKQIGVDYVQGYYISRPLTSIDNAVNTLSKTG